MAKTLCSYHENEVTVTKELTANLIENDLNTNPLEVSNDLSLPANSGNRVGMEQQLPHSYGLQCSNSENNGIAEKLKCLVSSIN